MSMKSSSSREEDGFSTWEQKKSNNTINNNNSNVDLVKARLSTAKAKRETRKKALKEDHQRNLKLKEKLQYENKSKDMYAIKVSVCSTIRTELRMNGREKRGRIFIDKDTSNTDDNNNDDHPYGYSTTLKGLRFQIHAFFRSLKKSTYILSASLPLDVKEDGSIVSANEEEEKTYDNFISLNTDDDVKNIFQQADDYFQQNKDVMKRPSLLLHVQKDPNAPLPPPTPKYLLDMPDPAKTPTMTMLSFYAFPPGDGILDAEQFAVQLKRLWKPFHALGRIYIATEGVNAQMSLPTNVLDNFMECCRSIPELGVHMENGINIDPFTLTMEEFAVAGDMDGKPVPPFRNLHIRVRNQVVADGLDKPLDWQSAGYDMPPMEWHETLKQAKNKQQQGNNDDDDDVPIVLDCRNAYETTVGRFDGAQPLDTTNFRDSWDVLKDKLKDTPKDAPIMTYCTGGIRCVKVGAYLTQELGFNNVSRLAGGIIAYDRTLNKNKNENAANTEDEESMFKGTNYVFDGRVGRQITDDALGECITCGGKTGLLSNCRNNNCHKRMVQCDNCRSTFQGTCSDACQQRIVNSDNNNNNGLLESSSSVDENSLTYSDNDQSVKYENIEEYSAGYSTPPPSLFNEIEFNTAHYLPTGSHMVSGATQGRLLTNLASMTRAGRILELGTFTGYATACLLEGAAIAGEAIGSNSNGNRESGPFVLTLERDTRAIDLAAAHIQIMSDYGTGEEAAEQACKLRADDSPGTTVEELTEESLTFSYKNAGCEIRRVNDALAIVEAMASGQQSTDTMMESFDIVFVDADKTRLLEYVEACLNSDKILKKGGFIIVDNVLWKGLVLDVGKFSSANKIFNEDGVVTLSDRELKKSRRARKLATLMHKFNSAIVKDERVEVVLLPIRDGLSILRKR